MKVYYLIANNGDGSTSVHWFQTEAAAKAAASDVDKLETYGDNEGDPSSFVINADGTTNLEFQDAEAKVHA